MSRASSVKISHTMFVLPANIPVAPDKNPLSLKKRVSQGSNGKVYPLPFLESIAEKPLDRKWQALRRDDLTMEFGFLLRRNPNHALAAELLRG